MKHFVVFFLAGSLLLWSACKNHLQPAGAATQGDSLSAKDSGSNVFFPVGDYLETEILYVDSTPLAVKKYTIQKDRIDSGYIQPAEFNMLAREFLLPEFKDGSFQKNYQETSFMDKSTQSATFTYSTTDKTLPLQRVDVITIPGVRANQVKSIYLEKIFRAGDSVVLQKMYWRAGRNFQILTQTNIHGNSPVEKQVKVVWNNDEEE
jgi:hypothetical protein